MSGFIPVEALSALSPQALGLLAPADLPAMPAPKVASGDAPGSFGQLVSDGIARLNTQLIGNQVELQKLAAGDAQNLHQVMVNLEESRLSFQLMLQVRSRLLEAYQDIMKMPV